MADRWDVPTIRHFENRRGEGPGDEVGLRLVYSSPPLQFIRLFSRNPRSDVAKYKSFGSKRPQLFPIGKMVNIQRSRTTEQLISPFNFTLE